MAVIRLPDSPVYDPDLNCYRVRLADGKTVLLDEQDLWIMPLAGWKAKRADHVAANMFLHRLIMRAKPGEEVDHINRNRLDCRKSNLRICSTSQNCQNRGKVKHFGGRKCSSRFKGVSLHPDGRWYAYIKLGKGKLCSLGGYRTEVEAAHVYDHAAKAAFGEFAVTNQELGLYDDAPATKPPPAPTECAHVKLKTGHVAFVDFDDESLMSVTVWKPRRKGAMEATVQLARLIMRPPGNLVVDHINGNPLDYRRSNLRICPQTKNMQNRLKQKGYGRGNCSSRFKGVSRWPNGTWLAYIRHEGKLHYLGTFAVEQDAALAYDAAAREYYGEFAKTNEDLLLV